MIAELDRILSHGLTAVQARAILGLYASQGDARLAPRMSTIAQWCHITTAAATGLIDRMEKDGHIIRCHSPHDRRSIFLNLTAKGKETAEQLLNAIGEARRDKTPPQQ